LILTFVPTVVHVPMYAPLKQSALNRVGYLKILTLEAVLFETASLFFGRTETPVPNSSKCPNFDHR
jgi:hypothetical protein